MEKLNFIQRKLKQIRFNSAKRLADSYHAADGKRYFVVPYGSQFVIMNNIDRKAINRRHKKATKLTINELFVSARYFTK